MRLRLGDILRERGLKPARLYEQAVAMGLPLNRSVIYRLAAGQWKQLDGDRLEMLCAVLDLADPGELFEREPARLEQLKLKGAAA
jgi:DNA-binding Xre family transcriptional regulator